MLKIFNSTVIYILCPSKVVSGGPEALHQLRYYLEKSGYKAFIVYKNGGSCPERYLQYEPKIVNLKKIKDDHNNILIIPESATRWLKLYKKCRKVIWWLSYNNYDGLNSFGLKDYIKDCIKKLLNLFLRYPKYELLVPPKKINKYYNVCASQYSFLKLKEDLSINNQEMLVEPISMDFLRLGLDDNLSSVNRGDAIPYNPAKPSEIMTTLLKRNDLQFIPIKGMLPIEIANLFKKSKLYIDFGSFPGPERLPKESVYNGTCLLVGKKNAAENDFDVAIPDKFKVTDYNNEELVVSKIKDILLNYDNYINEFAPFREKIQCLEENFIIQIKNIFIKTKTEAE